MSEQQVERIYPNFEHYDHMFAFGTQKVFGLRSYFAAGCEFSLTLGFSDNALDDIGLESRIIKRGSFDDRICHAKGSWS
jgi:hypothetical protein